MNNLYNDMMLNKDFNTQIFFGKKIYYESEHNIVSENAINSIWSISNATHIQSNITEIYKEKKYLIVIHDIQSYKHADFIINYSKLNIEAIKLSNKLSSELFNKILYLPPFIFALEFNKNQKRNINVITTFINISDNVPLRKNLLNNLKINNINHTNYNNIFCKNSLCELYDNTKILINIHQTPYHHTLEEFRILPALSRGVVIISEISPLINLLPYYDYIIWTTYDNVIKTVKNTIQNYDKIYSNFFGNKSKLFQILNKLNKESLDNINLVAKNSR